ncbi:hypothetical protein JNJ66_00570 [Candidatus Saccharibacteria bacterium]|nr:hypothetical protein [Candidatus Saccharibacteria bacterium]
MAAGILLAIFLCLYFVAFFSKRRFGILALGLCAGTLLSQYFTGAASALLEGQGVEISALPLATVVGMALTMMPVLFLLASGPAYGKKLPRIIGSLLFAVLGVLFLVPVLKVTVVNDTIVQQFFMYVTSYGSAVTAGLIIWAVIDTMLASAKKGGKAGHGDHGH